MRSVAVALQCTRLAFVLLHSGIVTWDIPCAAVVCVKAVGVDLVLLLGVSDNHCGGSFECTTMKSREVCGAGLARVISRSCDGLDAEQVNPVRIGSLLSYLPSYVVIYRVDRVDGVDGDAVRFLVSEKNAGLIEGHIVRVFVVSGAVLIHKSRKVVEKETK